MNNEQDVVTALNTINECLLSLGERIKQIEEYVTTMAIHEKILYKPNGHEKYLNIKENYDHIYQRLDKLEKEGPWDVK
tara:strand:+ start:3707 stop:3940 length:234 start_codon:yes stop_codon:yes gene_type:complete